MRVQHQILGNLKENKEDWYYLCNDAEQALFKVKEQCKDERAIKSLERMILDLNNIRMEQYKALTEYSLVEDVDDIPLDVLNSGNPKDIDEYYSSEYYKKAEQSKNSEEVFDNVCYSAAADYMSDVNEETSEDFIRNNIAYQAKLNYEQLVKYEDRNKYSDEDFFKEVVYNLQNERGIKFDFLKESIENSNLVKVKIYQIQPIENCSYAFMNYDFAKDKINIKDYKEVASIAIERSTNINTMLDEIFRLGNIEKQEFTTYGPFRSISVSDIIELDGKKYYVDGLGFKELNI